MRLVRWLLLGHLLALLFGLGGLLIALPHPELWAGSPQAALVFNFGMRYAGPLHIWLGLATMLALGLRFVGVTKTLLFLGLSTVLSAGFELIGTGTGWPFGNYAYTNGLGFKLLGRVPYTIPLSWFYMGFASYLLATVIAAGRWKAPWKTVLLGVWFLTVWDLVLDPAMAHESLPIKFWVWYEQGPYFGMPIKNFAGWSVTGLAFMGLSRLLWRTDALLTRRVGWVPFAVYLANIVFASALSLSVGLWQPPLIAVILGVLPALLALRGPQHHDEEPRDHRRSGGRFARRFVRGGASAIVARRLDVEIEGLEQLPADGPALLVPRHFHHLYDGCLLLARLPRPISLLVGLDWAGSRLVRSIMERACRAAGWPIVLRPEMLRQGASGAYQPHEVGRYLRRGIGDALAVLRAGELLAIFPEGYPVIDPHSGRTREARHLLPFRPGFARIAALAEKQLGRPIPIIPIGLAYRHGRRWRVIMRIGAPIFLSAGTRAGVAACIAEVESQVRRLSAPLAAEPALTTEAAGL